MVMGNVTRPTESGQKSILCCRHTQNDAPMMTIVEWSLSPAVRLDVFTLIEPKPESNAVFGWSDDSCVVQFTVSDLSREN